MEYISLLQKYDVPTPRYTSYPTVPFWDTDHFNEFNYILRLQNRFTASNHPYQGISLYLHLPYCESLCTYCGCNKRITTNHNVELPYINALLKEWELYKKAYGEEIYLAELHLGGGTPTFFSAENLDFLLTNLLKGTLRAKKYEFSVEVHPNFLNEDQLAVFKKHDFNRISLGVQDVDIVVQKAIHRIQSKETTTLAVENARKSGFEGINIDLVYGLPKQTMDSIKQTVDAVLEWKPERIALYSYAHVPWKSISQRGYDENDLPQAKEKLEMYQYAKEKLTHFGYVRIGMDHFALPLDPLVVSYDHNMLHRNFMGYTPRHTEVLVGLGVSSISDCWDGFVQNEKDLDVYLEKVEMGKFPIEKGHLHTETDLFIRKHILNLMCQNFTEWDVQDKEAVILKDALVALQPLFLDGLVNLTKNSIEVTPKGESFVRNICYCLDQSQKSHSKEKPLFSRAI